MNYNEIHTQDKGRGGVFWRAALGIVFLYLNFAAYQLLGLAGIVITSGFFILAQYSPLVVRSIRRRREKPSAQPSEIPTDDEPESHTARTASVVPLRLVSQAEQKGL